MEDPDSITPVSSYEISILSPSSSFNLETASADMTTHSFIVVENGTYQVGVSARNFAGISAFTYDQLGESPDYVISQVM